MGLALKREGEILKRDFILRREGEILEGLHLKERGIDFKEWFHLKERGIDFRVVSPYGERQDFRAEFHLKREEGI